MDVTVEQAVAAPIDAAFDAMADARREVRWNSQVTRSDLTSGEPIVLGSTFETVNRGQTYHATITQHDRPNKLAFAVTGTQMDIATRFTFRSDGDGSIVDAVFDFEPKGIMRLLMPFLAGSIRKDIPRQMASFARTVDPTA